LEEIYHGEKSSLIRYRRSPEKLLQDAHEAVLENAGFLCGLIRDKEDSMLGDLRYIDNQALFNLREERMMRMMILEVI
jgi:hypothetical protein